MDILSLQQSLGVINRFMKLNDIHDTSESHISIPCETDHDHISTDSLSVIYKLDVLTSYYLWIN